jgi:cell division transport system ATP-binding protein
MIRFKEASKRYSNDFEALNRVSFALERGEMAFLTGRSGAGKSTLLKLIAAIERPTRGQVFVDGRNITNLARRHIPWLRRRIGLVFQNYQLLHDRTVFDNVALPLVIAGLPQHEIGKRTRAALNKVKMLPREKALPITLSGGEQQRVSIARAVVNRPPILLADEPTGNLDPDLSDDIMHLFQQFHQVGVTVLIASHAIDLITRFNKRIITLEHGRLLKTTVVPPRRTASRAR